MTRRQVLLKFGVPEAAVATGIASISAVTAEVEALIFVAGLTVICFLLLYREKTLRQATAAWLLVTAVSGGFCFHQDGYKAVATGDDLASIIFGAAGSVLLFNTCWRCWKPKSGKKDDAVEKQDLAEKSLRESLEWQSETEASLASGLAFLGAGVALFATWDAYVISFLTLAPVSIFLGIRHRLPSPPVAEVVADKPPRASVEPPVLMTFRNEK